MERGNINEFIERDRDVNRVELVCRHLTPQEPYRCIVQLAGVASGLVYMHDLRLVHGDLKGVRDSLELYLHTSHLSEGEYPDQQGPASLHRRLRFVNDYCNHNSRPRERSGVAGFNGLAHVVY